MIISIHIPKTAGGSFRGMLQHAFGNRLYMDYGDPYEFMDPTVPGFDARLHRLFNRAKGALRRRQFFRTLRTDDQCIHGHFKASKYLATFEDPKLVVWLRNPADRIASHYYYWQRRPDFGHSLCRRLHREKLTLLEFAALEPLTDFQAKYLDGVPLSQFWFVGIQEEFPTLSRQFLTHLGKDAEQLTSRHINPRKKATDPYELSKSTRRELMALNPQDQVLYEQALENPGFRVERS